MIDKFKNLPVDEGTRIISTIAKKIDNYDVAYQKWSWDGISADSIIFLNEDVSSLSKEEILMLVQKQTLWNLNPQKLLIRVKHILL